MQNLNEADKIQYVSDIIGEQYFTWGNFHSQRKIFITTPTGSGKSTFILYELLKFAISQNRKILYLVNRGILKEQLYEEIEKNVSPYMTQEFLDKLKIAPIKYYIDIKTYQSIESLSKFNYNTVFQMAQEYYYIVYDECHYFYSDSNFNTNTYLSFDMLLKTFDSRVQIFMSATMKRIKKAFEEYWINTRMVDTQNYNEQIIEYVAPVNYSNVSVRAFKNIEMLVDKIKEDIESNTKGLLFVDSINLGKKLTGLLCSKNKDKSENKDENIKAYNKSQIAFITAEYEKENDSLETVEDIVRYNYSDKKIIITTPVMDNGISIHDVDLRNLVILTDIEETFIQMLGRKRNSGEEFTIYISNRDENYFKNRYNIVTKILNLYEKYALYRDSCWKKYQYSQNPTYFLEEDFNHFVLNDIMSSEYIYKKANKFIYIFQGKPRINFLSIDKFKYLQSYYSGIISKIKEDEYVFIKKQCDWLEKNDEEKESIIKKAKQTQDDFYREKLEELILELINWQNIQIEEIIKDAKENKKEIDIEKLEPITSEKNIEFKIEAKEYFIYFLMKAEASKNEIDSIIKKDRPISPDKFNPIMEIAQLPYVLIGRGNFRINKIN